MIRFKEFITEGRAEFKDLYSRDNKASFISKAIKGEIKTIDGPTLPPLSANDPLIKYLENTDDFKTKEIGALVQSSYGKSMTALAIDKGGNGFSTVGSSTKARLSSKGDVAEGILATALYMKLAGLPMNESTYNKIVESLKPGQVKSTTTSSGDTVNLLINLAPRHFESFTEPGKEYEDLRRPFVNGSFDYANTKNVTRYKEYFDNNKTIDTIDVVSDGLSDQKGTKTDLYVDLTRSLNGKDVTKRLRMNISLKAGPVKQFGQVSGSEYENQQELWNAFGISLSGIKSKYNKLKSEGKQSAAITLAYKEAQKQLKKTFAKKGVAEVDPIITLLKAITHHATLGENVELVQLDKGSFKSFKMNKSDANIERLAKEHDFTVDEVEMSKGSNGINLPKFTIKVDGKKFLTIRAKQDIRKEAESFYARNYIEKEAGFKTVFSSN